MKVEDIEDFDEILEQAESNSDNDWEMDFVSDIRTEYERYGGDALISEKQLSKLEQIANKE